jgi:hypothetical protein
MSLGTKTISMVHSLLAEEGKGTRDPAASASERTSDEQAELVEEERAEDAEDAPSPEGEGSGEEGNEEEE